MSTYKVENELNLTILPLKQTNLAVINHIIANKTKPLGALGQLESIAAQIALIFSQSEIIDTDYQIPNIKASMLVFAADHGIADKGVSIAPSEVTQQMVMNFLNQGAAINCFCRVNQIDFNVIDAGIKYPLSADIISQSTLSNVYINQSVGQGTADLSEQAAMSIEQTKMCLQHGAALAKLKSSDKTPTSHTFKNSTLNSHSNLFAFGEMGIANTSAASALMSVLLNLPAHDCVGKGTGITNEQLAVKLACVEKAVARVNQLNITDPIEILSQLGGFEIAQIIGAMLAAASQQKPILVDGFIVTCAALVATKINANVKDYFIFAHQSEEQAHKILLEHFKAKPLLNLGLRLGEGTGAALAVPLIRCAVEFFNQMATFDTASVNKVNI